MKFARIQFYKFFVCKRNYVFETLKNDKPIHREPTLKKEFNKHTIGTPCQHKYS